MLQNIRGRRLGVNARVALQAMLMIALLTGQCYVSVGWAQPPDTNTGSAPAMTPAGGPPAPGGMIRRGEKGLESTSLEDLMLEKGLITTDDWIRIKADEEQKSNERSVVAEFTGSPRWYERISMFGYGMFRYNLDLQWRVANVSRCVGGR